MSEPGPVTRAEKAEAEVKHLTKDLAECYRLSGAAPDGDSDAMLARYAMQEVKRLRGESDQLADIAVRLEDLAEDCKRVGAEPRASGEGP